jgi:hypothetical protein
MRIEWITNGGASYTLLHDSDAPGKAKIAGCEVIVDRLSGIGLPPPRHEFEQGPYQDGKTWRLSRLEPRQITLGVKLDGDPKDLVIARRVLSRLFYPSVPIIDFLALKITDGGGNYRLARCLYESGAEWDLVYNERDEFRMDVKLIGVDGYLIDGGSESHTITAGVTGAWSTSENVENYADWDAYPSITITGPITNPAVTNQSFPYNDPKIELAVALTGGQSAVITTIPGYKTISGDASFANLTTDSDLANWRLLPEAWITGGLNSILVTGTNATSGVTKVAFSWQPLWLTF